MSKTCTKCGETKPIGEFHRKKRGKYGVTGQCKACIHAYMKLRKRVYVQRGRDLVDQYAKDTGQDRCVKCGSTDKLEWDHIDPNTKVFPIAREYDRNVDTIMSELKKCQRLCKSCHIAKGEHGGRRSKNV